MHTKIISSYEFRAGSPDGARAAAKGTQQGAEDDEEEREEDADGESTEDVDQHVRVAVLPEDSAQHLCRVVPARHGGRRDGEESADTKRSTTASNCRRQGKLCT